MTILIQRVTTDPQARKRQLFYSKHLSLKENCVPKGIKNRFWVVRASLLLFRPQYWPNSSCKNGEAPRLWRVNQARLRTNHEGNSYFEVSRP